MKIISAEQERKFEKRHIEKQRDKYLNANALERYKNDIGYREKVNLIKNFLENYEEKSGYVLDLGANTAGESEILFHFGHNMVPTDINEIALSYSKIRAKKFRNEELSYYAVDAHSLPFADETFDKIIAYEVLHHMERIEIVLSELFRVLKKGGHLFTVEPYAYNPYRRLSEIRDYFRGTIEKSFSINKLSKLFNNAQFQIINIQKTVLPTSEWKGDTILRYLYNNIAKRMPWLFGSLAIVAKKAGIVKEIKFDLNSRLICPITKSPLYFEYGKYISTNVSERRYFYPIYEGVPVLIKEDAIELNSA